jgi:TolA-binding protein
MNNRINVLVFLVLGMSVIAGPVAAQTLGEVERRIGRLESQMGLSTRAPIVPEARPAADNRNSDRAMKMFGELLDRLEVLERQVTIMTGQSEQNGMLLRRVSEDSVKLKGDTEFRMVALEEQVAALVAAPSGLKQSSKDQMSSQPTTAPVDTAESDFAAAGRLLEAQQWSKAEFALSTFLSLYPRHPQAAAAEYMLGRSFAAQGKHAQAAKVFLNVFQSWPNDSNVPDSLLGLGKSLAILEPGNMQQACGVYNEIETGFAGKLSDSQRKELLAGRIEAECK